MTIAVKETHWADSERATWSQVQDSIPAVLDTEFALWQKRVDMGGGMEWLPRQRLFTIRALRYESRDGCFQPMKPEEIHTFLVVCDNGRQASDRVLAELERHGYTRNEWSISFNASPLVLTAAA